MTTHVLVPRRSALSMRPFGAGLFDGDFGDFDRLFDEFWRGLGSPVTRAPTALAPRMDYRETDDAITLRAEMPGLEEEEIQVSLEDGVLTIKGEHAEERDEKDDDDKGFRHLETWRGSFHRALRLPADVDEDKVEAAYRNGILTVTLPKRPEAKPEVRSIPVTTS